ncbi:MAG: transketolase family protein, partial [Candidatus Thermoplasmatota archaeon]|nr:transketolase family protein [Candidatus Thermoplasmatota archaeon]
VIGGLAGAVSEHVVANQPIPIEMVGVQDRFGESGGSDELLQMLGLKSNDIVEAVKRVIARK